MSYIEQWNALAARIRSLRAAADLYAQFLISDKGDGFSVGGELVDQSRSILEALRGFHQSFHASLPPAARDCLERFLNGRPARVISDDWTKANEVKVGPVFLTAFESEMSFLLADAQEVIRARSERAFLHLQRLLVVDAEHRSKWKAAFDKKRAGEVSCEQLGAVHLLWHGIFAFKIDAHGARTDLAFSAPIDPSIVQRGIDGFVLTEWKLADEGNATRRFDEARVQLRLYQQGPLVSVELTGYRYAIAVSLTDLPKGLVPDDMEIGRVI